MYNPIQLVEKFRLRIPHIRNQDIVWYTVHMATINGHIIQINLSEWKMLDVTQFRFAKKQQHPLRSPIEYIASDETLRRYLSGARRHSWESFDGGRRWVEDLNWTALT